ncbi:Transmembrane secretion effector [Arthrobacter sp. yr096]|uniref:MFS transporter n=1 Tax=Arthrobacter sp. yr096 TaxID=1761750 RepID=UPI0008AE052D|nr:MFS transporter [Arthrobacter sp. yr096]SEI96718.1 Transmembrane secretion effector [Arthrobacter sp. yr096]
MTDVSSLMCCAPFRGTRGECIVTLPLYAPEILHGDAQVVSALFIAVGAGAIIGVLAIAGILQATPGRLILASLIFAALLFAISLAPNLIPALILLFLLGAAGVAYRVITTSMAQLEADPIMRGRTMGFVRHHDRRHLTRERAPVGVALRSAWCQGNAHDRCRWLRGDVGGDLGLHATPAQDGSFTATCRQRSHRLRDPHQQVTARPRH